LGKNQSLDGLGDADYLTVKLFVMMISCK